MVIYLDNVTWFQSKFYHNIFVKGLSPITFKNLKKWKWKMNPNKCVFGVPSGQLLGFLVSHHGIKASAKQIGAITEMGPPRCVKDVQKLTGCMAALNRFISQLGEKGQPFFKLLKKTCKFKWTEEAKEAFESLKAYLTSSPVLTPPKKAQRHDAIHYGNFYGGQRSDRHGERRRGTRV
jgi:hypothetical protein